MKMYKDKAYDERAEKATKNKPIAEYDDDDDDDNDEEEENEADVENLIDDAPIEEDDESMYLQSDRQEPSTATKRHYSYDDDDDELDEDDLALLEENTGLKFRKDPPPKPSKRRRLVVESDDDNEDERSAVVSETVERHNRRIDEPIDEEYEPNYEDDEDDDDFIDDDDGGHQPGPTKNRAKARKHAELSEAYEVFGNDFTMDDEEEYEQNYDEETEAQDAPHQLIEPTELERAHLTARDIQIRESGLPERFQLRNIPVSRGEDEELQEEAEWIYKLAFKIPSLSRQTFSKVDKNVNNESCVIFKIFEALKLIRQMNLEVPFIAFYRKEVVQPELSITDLWRIFHWDGKWMQMRSKKQNLLRLFENFQKFQFEENSSEESFPSSFRRLTENDFESLRAADTVEQLKDISDHFNLYYSKDVARMKSRSAQVEYGMEYESGSVIKQSKVNSGYNQCVNAGLIDLATKYGLTPEQFAENMRDNYQRHEVKQEFVSPITLATDYLKGYFSTPEEVLKGANCIVATQIANDPTVRSCLRSVFHERCMISVKPTTKGINVIDENHPCYSFRYLKDKPVRDLIDDQYLIIHSAEVDTLLKVDISIDSNIYRSTYLDEIKPHYERNEFSDIVQDWNKLREKVVEKAFKDILYPMMTREMKNKLLDEAKEFVISSCRQRIYRWLEVAAYQALDDYCDEDEIMGIAYSDTREEPSVAVTIDKNGLVKETLKLHHLWEWNGKKKDEDFDSIFDFVKSKKPIVIAVGSDSTKVLMFINDLKYKLKGKKLGKINVEFVDNELAKVYALSKTAERDLKDYSLKHRQAISIARRIQDPLIEFSQLCNLNEDILNLRFHPLQDYIDKDTLLENLYQEFVNRVNEVGVDINRCIEYPHTENLIQFVCGLGPRKGFHMLKLLKKEDLKFLNRAELVAEPLRLGQSVYINCAGFLKIDTKAYKQYYYDDNTVACIIDGSRIHPESYRYARKMAGDALDKDDPEYEDQDQEDEYLHQDYAEALEDIVDEPSSLQELQLEAFADELEAKKGEKKLTTLNDIRSELTNMYKDFRTPYRSPDDPEIFHMLTKETPQTFYIGKLVSCKVVGIAYSNKGNRAGQPAGVKTYLDCGVRGFIPIAMLADHRVNHPEEVVKINMMMPCRITKIDIVKFQVELTSKYSRISNNKQIVNFDQYFDFTAEAEEINNTPINKVVARQGYVKRIVSHPCFQNIDHIACQKQMESLEQGEAIIRPSSKEANRLILTWKVGDGVVQIVDIWEEGKAIPSSLGKKLIIGNESFEDLDEIIARWVQPMASFARDLINYKYFKYINANNMDDETFIGMILAGEKQASPNRIPYCFTLSKKFPGKFIMSYLPRNTPKHDYVTATPDGLRLRGQMFNNLPNLLKWFKENC